MGKEKLEQREQVKKLKKELVNPQFTVKLNKKTGQYESIKKK